MDSGVTSQDRSGIVPGRPVRPMRRRAGHRVIGGVCGGLARRLGVRPTVVRILAILSALVVGAGLVIYVALWLCVEREGEDESILARTVHDRHETQITLVVGTIVVAMLTVVQALGLADAGSVAWPVGISAVGLVVVWRNASGEERIQLQDLVNSTPVVVIATSKSKKAVTVRAAVGIGLAIFGVLLLTKVGAESAAAVGAAVGAALLGLGCFVLFAPWWLRTARELSSERRERVRAEERATVATHLHDSVLQTLTLIQRAAADPVEVARLARIQERDLRAWLFDPTAFATRSGSPTTVAGAAAEIEREVEDSYGMAIELVVVGDAPLDDAVASLLAAGREAAVNAAKWSRAASVSVYVEVEGERVTMFVRDVGVGFDPADVPHDRQGITRSIVERMERCGGTATVRSTIGEGTEVALSLPRRPLGQ